MLTDEWEEATRAALHAAAGNLEGISHFLKGIHDSAPIPREERDRRDLDRDPAPVTEFRAVIKNVLASSLQPAIEDLRAAAEYQPEKPAARPLWNLTVYSAETERLLYGLVVRDNFTAKPLADPGDVWIPPYTPERAELRVFFDKGRWFATWKKLEVPKDFPAEERWEFLRVEEDRDNPGNPYYHEI